MVSPSISAFEGVRSVNGAAAKRSNVRPLTDPLTESSMPSPPMLLLCLICAIAFSGARLSAIHEGAKKRAVGQGAEFHLRVFVGPEQAEVSAECEPGLAVRDYDGAFLQGGRHLLRLAGCGLQGHRSGDQAGQEGDSFHRCRVLTGYTGLQSLA